MVLPPEAKLPNNLSIMASTKPQSLPTCPLSCLKLEGSNLSDTNCSNSESKNQKNSGSDDVENGISYTWGKVSDEKPTKLKIVIHHFEKNVAAAFDQGMGGEGQDRKELGQRTWNLRPRTALRKPSNEMRRLSGMPNSNCNILETTQKQKLKFSITLTLEEIKADFLAMTGSKPPRKPKRRPKNMQNIIDVRQCCNIITCLDELWLKPLVLVVCRICPQVCGCMRLIPVHMSAKV